MSQMHLSRAAALVALVLLAVVQQTSAGDWVAGRATFYGTDAWPIHTGSCRYGYLDRNVGTGWDVAAMPDTDPDYKGAHNGKQCGLCRAVKCRSADFADGYGQWLERSNVCFDKSATVLVQVVDTCDCNYASNAYSNRRWCCGDMRHMDLSYWAYTKLADPKWGVIGISFKNVPCSYIPRKRARRPSWVDKKEWVHPAPSGWSYQSDRRRTALGARRRTKECPTGFCKNH